MSSKQAAPTETSSPRARAPSLFGIVGFSFGLTLVSSTLEPALLGHKVLTLTPDMRASVYGALTAIGVLVAMIAQPVAGWLSDRATILPGRLARLGRRLPFMLAGTAGVSAMLLAVAAASSLPALFASVGMLQLATNTGNSPWQALIPERVRYESRGTAAASKAILDLLAAVIGRLVAGELVAQAPVWGDAAIWAASIVALVGLVISLAATSAAILRTPTGRDTGEPLVSNASEAARASARPIDKRIFVVWFVNRLLFWCAFIASSTFLLFVAVDVLGMTEGDAQRYISRVSVILGIALMAVLLPSGRLADHWGRKPLIVLGGLCAGAGTLALLSTRDSSLIILCAIAIGVGVGTYMSSSPALLNDIVPEANAARTLGIANIATAAGSATARLGGGFLVDAVNAATGTRDQGYLALLALAAALYLASAVVLLILWPGGSRASRQIGPSIPSRSIDNGRAQD